MAKRRGKRDTRATLPPLPSLPPDAARNPQNHAYRLA